MTSSPSLTPTQGGLLCVDDDPDILKLRRMVLESAGYVVITAASGDEALQVLEGGQPVALVLLDYLMPGMRGDELAIKLRRQNPRLPIIAVSAVGQLPDSLLRNVNAHVQKGRGPEVLLATVSMILGQRDQDQRDVPLQPIVLCVEDEELQLKFRKMLFESCGYSVLDAQSADRAIEIFQSQHVDLVLMDYSLSGKNGLQVAAEMKRLRPNVPIIMLSGFATLPDTGEDVDLWLHKMDIEPEDLVNQANRLIRLPNSNNPAADSQ